MLALLDQIINRRRDKRVKPPANSPIEVQIIGLNSLDVCNANDISSSGIGVRVPHRFEGCNVSMEVELVVTLPKCRPFSARGIIRNISDNNNRLDLFGIEFTQISDSNRDLVLSYVDGHCNS